jgi:hypothetical protein
MKGWYRPPISSRVLAMAMDGGYCVKDAWHRQRSFGAVSLEKLELSERYNIAPHTMSCSDIEQLFFDHEAMFRRPKAIQGRRCPLRRR